MPGRSATLIHDGTYWVVNATLNKTDVGLSNVDNTADTDKPVSTAQATAISTAESTAIAAGEAAAIAAVAGGGGDSIANSVVSIPRRVVTASTASMASGSLRLTAFTADKTITAANVVTITGGTAAGATPTLCRVGIYSVDGSDNLTLIGSIASDTTLWAAGSTRYTKALSATVAITEGSRYAIGILVVTGAAMPSFYGNPATPIHDALTAPFVAAQLAAQSDLPASITAASLQNSTTMMYARLTT